MANISLKNFLDLLKRSRLLEEDVYAQAVMNYWKSHAGDPPEDAESLADYLIAASLLTRWQCDKLLDGKFRGFYLGRYRLLDHLGTGGMSTVYLAEHVITRRRVAIKVLPKTRADDRRFVEHFRLQAKTAVLDHPNIVRIYDMGNIDDIHYGVLEYVPGKDLESIVRDNGPLDFDTAADYIAQAAAGLEYAHRAGIIHGDIRPSNLLVDGNNVVKILNLGIGLFYDQDTSSLTVDNEENVLGTADYLAPEQARNSHDIDARADIYSLGCTLYCLLTGHAPFPEGNLAQRIYKHQTEMPRDVRQERPDCPASLAEICTKMMNKKPQHRYPTAQAVIDALRGDDPDGDAAAIARD